MSISEYRAFNFPCEVPEVSWWQNTKIPDFRTVKSLGYRVLPVSDVLYTNSTGQVNNTARSIGTDNVNYAALKNSFENQGINPNFLPPIVLLTKTSIIKGDFTGIPYEENDEGKIATLPGKSKLLLDGFTRHSILVDKSQEKFVYLVVELKEGFSVQDAQDEIGLGLNNHPQSKRHTLVDFKKRLKRWINSHSDDKEVTSKDCIEWFNRIPNSFSDKEIVETVDKVLNEKLAAETTESFTNTTAKKRGAKLLNTNRVVYAFDNKTGASLETCLGQVIKHYKENLEVPEVVGFTKKVSAEDLESVRGKMQHDVDDLNQGLRLLARNFLAADRRGEGDSYEFVKLKGFLPQIVNIEEDIVEYD